jgi:hypothetical protein
MCIDVINDTDNVNVLVQVDKLAANAEAYSVSRSLEAYLLMLFNCVLLNNAHDDIVNKILLPYARTIADVAVLVYSSGSAMLAATYHASM